MPLATSTRRSIEAPARLDDTAPLKRPSRPTWPSASAATKPAPELYHWTLKQLNLPPRDCLAIEDSSHGLAASLAAGIPTVITVSDYTINENFDGARMVLPEADRISLDKLRLWHATASTS